MQVRSIILVFIVICLIVITFFSNVVEGGKVLDNKNQNSIHLNKNNFFAQRLRRKVRNTHRRYKRDDSNGGSNNPSGSDDENNAVDRGYQPQKQDDDQNQQYTDQNGTETSV